ncbi:MAG: GNAT family N-acetyltransferase [Chloroflexi bacterium]|nr:MAG: GNAT family N-acetyltransferase [Chloroflexota bacterium]
MSLFLIDPTFSEDLGDGLVRRWSTAADTEQVGLLLSTVHRDREDEPLNVLSHDLARIFMSGKFPFMDAGDFAVVEDTSQPAHPIVACTCLWRHQWRYAGIPLGVGRPEYVATDPAYRNRGLVRRLFEMVHARSEAEGHLLQAITGIAYFYRQFGYEYVMELDGNRTVYFSQIPDGKEGEAEPYQLRAATLEDIPQLMAFYDQQRADNLLWYEPDEAYWRFIVSYWDDPAVQSRDVTTLGIKGRYFMIIDNDGRAVGSTWVRTRRWGRSLGVAPFLSTAPDVDRPAVMASLLRLLRDQGTRMPGNGPDTPPCDELRFDLGANHPLYGLMGDKLALAISRPYAWYVRIPNLAAFLQHIAPVLEERLARSLLAGYTGELKIDLYREGLLLRFERGKLMQIERWRQPAYGEEAMAGSPPLVFLQLLLSHRSLEELRAFYPDVWADDKAKLLIDTLFPKLPSRVFEPFE